MQAFSWSNAPTWGLVAAAGVSSLVLGVFVCTPCNAAVVNTAVPFSFVHLLTAASVLLWISATAMLAAPTVPWVASIQRNDLYNYATFIYLTAFTGWGCTVDLAKKNLITSCTIFTGPGYLDLNNASPDNQKYASYMNAASDSGVVAYVAALGLLFPAALLTSIAAVRLTTLLRKNTSAPLNLVAAAVLAAVGGVFAIAICIAGSTLTAKFLEFNAPYRTFSTETAFLPGPFAAGLSAACAVAATVFTVIALIFMRTVPGVHVGWSTSTPLASSTHTAHTAYSIANPAAAPPPAPVVKQKVLPFGWSQHGPDEKGDVWYSDPAGNTTWNLP